jgi:transposase-like protein
MSRRKPALEEEWMLEQAPSHESRRSLSDLAESLDADLDALADDLSDVIHADNTELGDDLRVLTRASCRANIAVIVSLLRDGAEPGSATAPPEAVLYAHEFARRGHGVEALLEAYRVAHQRFYRGWIERLRRDARTVEALAEATSFSSDWLFAWMNAVSQAVTQAFMAERDTWVRTSAAIRTEAVRMILAGQAITPVEMSQRLGYELDRNHVAFIVWTDPSADADAASGSLEHLAGTIAGRLGSGAPLLVPQGRLRLDGWVHAAADAAPIDRRFEDAQSLGARVAIGLPGSGVDGFRQSHADAAEAQRLATLTRRSAGACVAFDDVMLACLLTSDVPAAERYVAFELGELTADTDNTRRITATLQVFLDENSSFTKTGRRLGVHENTVAYRVRRAEELLGHEIGERRLQIAVALHAQEILRKR